MGKKGPPYVPPDDAQWIVVLNPPHIPENSGKINYSPLEYWLRALFDDQRAAKFIYEIQKQPDLIVIVELPSPTDLPIPTAAYGLHSLRLGLKRRPWFDHRTGEAVILPYNFVWVGHPETTRKMCPMMSGTCDNEWEKLDLTIPYPLPQPFNIGRVPQGAVKFCCRPPDVVPPPPDPMEFDHYLTPPTQEREQVQFQPENDRPLFIPEDESKPKIKSLDPYQEEESITSFLRGSSSTTIHSVGRDIKPEPWSVPVAGGSASFNPSETHRESNALPSRPRGDSRLTAINDELGKNPLSVKQEFAIKQDAKSQRINESLQTVDETRSPSEEDVRLPLKRELENENGDSTQRIYQLLKVVKTGQSMHGDGPNIGMIKRDLESHPLEPRERVPSRNIGSGPQSPAPYKDQVRDSNIDCYRSTSSFSNSNSWRDPNERGDRERDDRTWRGDGERGRDYVGGGRDWKRSFAHPDNRDNRGSGDRREYQDKRSRASYQ